MHIAWIARWVHRLKNHRLITNNLSNDREWKRCKEKRRKKSAHFSADQNTLHGERGKAEADSIYRSNAFVTSLTNRWIHHRSPIKSLDKPLFLHILFFLGPSFIRFLVPFFFTHLFFCCFPWSMACFYSIRYNSWSYSGQHVGHFDADIWLDAELW